VMIKDGVGHHPHSLRDPKPMADFIEQSVQAIPSLCPTISQGTPHETASTAQRIFTATSHQFGLDSLLPHAGLAAHI